MTMDLDKLEAEFTGPFVDRELYADVIALVAEVRALRTRQGEIPEDILAEFELAMRAIERGNTNGGAAVVGLKNGWVDARYRAEAAEAQVEDMKSQVTALEARLAALTGALEQITSLPVSVGSLSDPNDSHKWWHIARSALAADPARGVMISAEEAELFIEMLEPSDTSPSADPELRESLRARLRPPGPEPEAAQGAP
jgi:hypothetical protein